jgi:cytochrome c oxidase subunit 1
VTALSPAPETAEAPRRDMRSWLSTTDHKRIAILTGGTALVLFFAIGALSLFMR